MSKRSVLRTAWLAALVSLACGSARGAQFIRGDADASGEHDISDAVRIFGYLFLGSPGGAACIDAADADDTGEVEITDGIYLLGFLFLGGQPPPAPFPTCGEDSTGDPLECEAFAACDDGVIRSARERDLTPDVEEREVAAASAGNARFALDLYRAVQGREGNTFFSPYSISLALAMTYAGARGETARQMASTLHYTLPQERLHPALNALDLELAGRKDEADADEATPFQLTVANAIWGQRGYSFLEPFLDVVAESYGAGLRTADFQRAAEDARVTINGWVSDATLGRIPDLLPPGVVTPDTRLVLTNAIYFKAAWRHPFPADATRDGEFTLNGGGSVTVPMMSRRAPFGVSTGDGYQAVELPYHGEKLSMVILLPDAGRFDEFEAALDEPRLAAIVGGLQPSDLELTLPRFGSTFELPLRETLASMGMPDAFAPGIADFSGMDGTRRLLITDVLHKAFIAVNEAGTEAAAATAVVVGVVSVPPSVIVNRPFIYLIRDAETGAVLFLGRVLDPSV